MAKKYSLVVQQEDPAYSVVGLSTSLRDYRLCFLLNKLSGFTFTRTEDLEIRTGDSDQLRSYSLFTCIREEEFTTYFLLTNRGQDSYLLPALKQVDFLLIIEGPVTGSQKKGLITRLREIPGMLLATEITGAPRKQLYTLFSDLEMHLMNVNKHIVQT